MCFYETNPPFFGRISVVSGYEYMRCTRNERAKSVGSFWKTNPPERVFGVVSGGKWVCFRRTKPVAADDSGVEPEAFVRKLAPQVGLEPLNPQFSPILYSSLLRIKANPPLLATTQTHSFTIFPWQFP
jgi:hypothetical protein